MTSRAGSVPPPGTGLSRRGALAATIAGTATAAAACAPSGADDGASVQGVSIGSAIRISKFGVRSDRNGSENTDALNAAIRHVAAGGGGTLIFDPAEAGYTVIGPVIVPSDVVIDLNGQLLRGRRQADDVMFVTGTFSTGRLKNNLDSAPETALVTGASIRNGRIEDCNRIFHFRNFGQGCQLQNLVTRNCVQVGRFERCFFSVLDTVSATGFSDPAIPSFHFIDQTNAVTLRRLSAVTAFGLCLEGGASAMIVDGFTFEGGETAVRLIGDCLGMEFRGGYFEAVTGHAFDLRKAGTCSADWMGNYFHHINTIFDDGGQAATATLFGTWHASNYVVTKPNQGFAKLGAARNIMRVDGPRDFVRFEAPYANDASAVLAANWIVSRNSRVTFETGQTGSSLTDIRTRSTVHAGTLPLLRSGDTGNPIAGTVPLSRVTAGKGHNATVILDTQIAWRPDTLFAKYLLSIRDDTGTVQLYGDIYGAHVVRHDSTNKSVTLSNQAGFLRLTAAGFAAESGEMLCTGSLQIV